MKDHYPENWFLTIVNYEVMPVNYQMVIIIRYFHVIC